MDKSTRGNNKKNMENKNIILLLILSLLLFSCKEFKAEKIELNYKEGYVKILSDNYVIDSLVIHNHINKYYIIGLSEKDKGSNIIYFQKENFGYKIYSDSLEYYCSKTPEVISPGIDIHIRKKGFLGRNDNDDFTNIEYFNYNQIPCNKTITDTIEASNPYK